MDYIEGKLNGIPTVSQLMDEVKKCEDKVNDKLDRDDLIAGENIEINDGAHGEKVISCTAEGKIYTGGEGINISDEDVISVDRKILTDYVTFDELSIELDDYALKENIPSKTSDLTNDSGFITNEVNNLTNYYNKTNIDTKLDNKQDTINDLNTIRSGAQAGASAVQPSALNDYVQKSQTSGLLKNDGTVDTNTYATTSQIPSTSSGIYITNEKPFENDYQETQLTSTYLLAIENVTNVGNKDINIGDLIIYVESTFDSELQTYTYKPTELYDIIQKDDIYVGVESDGSFIGTKTNSSFVFDASDVTTQTHEDLTAMFIPKNKISNSMNSQELAEYEFDLQIGDTLVATKDGDVVKKGTFGTILAIQDDVVIALKQGEISGGSTELLKNQIYDKVESDINNPTDGDTFKFKQNAQIDSLLENVNTDTIVYTNATDVQDNPLFIVYSKLNAKPTPIYQLGVIKGDYPDGEFETIDNYGIYFNNNYINQWQNGNALTLDIPYKQSYFNPLYKDYVFKFFKQLKEQTLEDKFNEEENVELKNKIYQKGDLYYKPLFKISSSTWDNILNIASSYSYNNPLIIYDEETEDRNFIVKLWTNSYSMQIFGFVSFEINNDIYEESTDYEEQGWRHTNDNWSNMDWITSQEGLPNITFNDQYITNENYKDLFYSLIYQNSSDITLEQNNKNVRNWVYDTEVVNLVDGTDYQLLDSYTDDFFNKTNNNFTPYAGTNIYYYLGKEIDLVALGDINPLHLILVNDTTTTPETCVGYAKEGNGWYECEWDSNLNGWALKLENNQPIPTSTPTLTDFQNNGIITGFTTIIKDIFGLSDKEITFDEKLKYIISDYTEDSGALTSITVKDKTTGEPIVLTVGGGKQLYQHFITVQNSNDTNIFFTFTIINDSNTSFTTITNIGDYLRLKGFVSNSQQNIYKLLGVNGQSMSGSSYYVIKGITFLNNEIWWLGVKKDNTSSSTNVSSLGGGFTVNDITVAL